MRPGGLFRGGIKMDNLNTAFDKIQMVMDWIEKDLEGIEYLELSDIYHVLLSVAILIDKERQK